MAAFLANSDGGVSLIFMRAVAGACMIRHDGGDCMIHTGGPIKPL
ncbi:hypothetical protein SXCC_04453 [Gluconacetobacter sp. SXCC-1]|nr:hypothetical protein SXCC_04453 [Gluconacetobacter sp. SXCC-1]